MKDRAHNGVEDSHEVWMLDGFDPRDLSARFWRYADSIRYVVGRVAYQQAMYTRRRNEHRGWVPLRWKEVAPLFGRSGAWNLVRQALLEREILECDEEYTAGVKSKWYRLGRAWLGQEPRLCCISDQRTATRIKRLEAVHDNRSVWVQVHHHIARWLSEVSVDDAQVRRWTCQRHRSIRQHLTAMKVAVIQSGRATIKVCPYGRVHSPVVTLRSVARPALRISGMPLAEADIANAQPLINGYLVAKVVTGEWRIEQAKQMGIKAQEQEKFNGYMRVGGERRNQEDRRGQSHTICLPNLHLTSCLGALSGDLSEYMDVCQKGEFYEALAEAWSLPCEPGRAKNRIKYLTFKYVLFGRPRPGHCYWEGIRRRWPTVAQVLEEIKVCDHGTAARACQRIESSLMIGGVVGQLRLAHPDVAVQTIHDSLLVHPDMLDLAIETIRDVFGAIGLRPLVKVKRPERSQMP